MQVAPHVVRLPPPPSNSAQITTFLNVETPSNSTRSTFLQTGIITFFFSFQKRFLKMTFSLTCRNLLGDNFIDVILWWLVLLPTLYLECANLNRIINFYLSSSRETIFFFCQYYPLLLYHWSDQVSVRPRTISSSLALMLACSNIGTAPGVYRWTQFHCLLLFCEWQQSDRRFRCCCSSIDDRPWLYCGQQLQFPLPVSSLWLTKIHRRWTYVRIFDKEPEIRARCTFELIRYFCCMMMYCYLLHQLETWRIFSSDNISGQ